jgi:acyl-CoA thioester hydrolase
MARTRLDLPEQFSFKTSIPVRITDLNYGNHVGNDSVLSIIHEARVQFLKHYGYSELKIEEASLIMSDVTIEFKAEIFYGDTITVMVTAGDFARVSFDIFYKLMTSEEKIVAVAKTGMVCFDYEARKVVAVPVKARTTLKG